ncbi:AMP-binding protein [Actinoplanes sp. TRM88002]|uniref:AMP-binding protein n=1 Tax=Paractinoplanes hotanensis TaxID=2906497 RepID=A0ABT0XTS6_9ACTN|nr:AMP-binding protein [Actinoplanes hotanensis]MCM4077185.1 AMP-binding protein [Actinoplanes hotanensis]
MDEAARDAVAAAAAHRPTGPALITGETTLTWSDVDRRVTAAAHRIAGLVSPGGRVAIVLGTSIEFVVTYFGVLRSGRVAVPLNPAYSEGELEFAITDSAAELVVAEEDGPGRVRPQFDLDSAEPAGGLPQVKARDLAVLLYTSGTSGRPKGAMLTHAALDANHDQLDAIDPPVVGADDVVLLAVPLFHAYGLNTGLGSVVHHAATGVLIDHFDPAASLAVIAERGVTVVVGVPGMYSAWSRQPGVEVALRSVRSAVCGAAPLAPDEMARFGVATGKTIVVGYGLTETAPVLTTTAVSDRGKPGSIGRPLPGVSLRLRSPAGQVLWEDGTASPEEDLAELDLSVEDVAGTDPGEIVVRGANLFSGYWPDGRGGPGPDGWWATGDVAYADADGDLHLVDRVDDLILVHGFNVYPAEIERVLASHPGVAESAVLGVPDDESGQRPHAFVVAAIDPPPTQAELQVYCAAQLARFKLPTVELVRELPHSATGKVRKRELLA